MKKKFEVQALIEKLQYGHCLTCIADDNVFCKRDCDAKCLECGKGFCAGHIIKHLKDEHQMTETMDHCTKRDGRKSPEFCSNCNSKNEKNEVHLPITKIVKGKEVKYCEIRIRREKK